VPLEESVAIYERGEVLKARCEELLRQAEARVEKITLDASGKPTGTDPRRRLMALAVQVRRRLVIYVQAMTARSRRILRMFRREYRDTCALYGLSGKVGKPANDPERHITTWDAQTDGQDPDGKAWHVDTRYMFLRWEDIIRQDFARPSWWKILAMYRVLIVSILSGVALRVLRAHCASSVRPLPDGADDILAGAGRERRVRGRQACDRVGAPAWLGAIAGIVTGFGAFAAALRLTESQTIFSIFATT